MKKTILLILSSLAFVACSHNKVAFDPNLSTLENEPGGLKATVIWLKNKKNNIDLLFRFYSTYKEDILIKESSYVLEYEGQKIAAKYGTDDSLFRPQHEYQKLVIFPFLESRHRTGEVTITIDPILRDSDKKPLKPMKFVLPLRVK